MRIHRETLERSTLTEIDLQDITEEVAEIVAASKINDGLVLLFVPGSTAGLTTLEFESGAVADLKRALERLAPIEEIYAHDARWGDGNGHAHVRAALLGPSLCLPVAEGRPVHGTWQQIVLCDFDNRPRTRRVLVQVLGE